MASIRYIDDVPQVRDIELVESVQRGMHTPAFTQGRIVYGAAAGDTGPVRARRPPLPRPGAGGLPAGGSQAVKAEKQQVIHDAVLALLAEHGHLRSQHAGRGEGGWRRARTGQPPPHRQARSHRCGAAPDRGAQAHPDYAEINAGAQHRHRSGLAALIREPVPGVSATEADRRVSDIDVIQNGIWLTALSGLDQEAVGRNLKRCEDIAWGYPVA